MNASQPDLVFDRSFDMIFLSREHVAPWTVSSDSSQSTRSKKESAFLNSTDSIL